MRPLLEWFDDTGFYVARGHDVENDEPLQGPVRLQLFDFQRRILKHVFTPNEKGIYPYKTVVYSTIKKSGKTTIGALVASWVAECAQNNSEIFVVANDKEQAWKTLFSDMSYHALHSGKAKPMKYRIEYPDTGTYIQVLANEYASAAGSRHILSVWDELWGYRSDNHLRMWAEMTPPPTEPNAFRFISTYAGFENESKLLYDIYKGAWEEGEVIEELADLVNSHGDPICRHKGDIFVMWDNVPRLPWQTDEYYESQMATMRPADFLRLHRNQWVSSSESFIDTAMWDRNIRLDAPLTTKRDDERLNFPVYLGVDIGTKHDCSAVVAVYYDLVTQRVGLAAHRIWTPEGNFFDIENTVEKYILDLYRHLNVVHVGYDPSQFHRSAFTLKSKGIPVAEFKQTAGLMTEATQTLFTLLNTDSIDLYKDDELRNHIKYSTAVNTNRGFRLTKDRNANFKIDAAVALAMAVHTCVSGAAPRNYETLHIDFPYGDVSPASAVDPRELMLPEALRS